MNRGDIYFEDYEMTLQLKGVKQSVSLVLLDDLEASEEELSNDFKDRICHFINSVDDWYEKVVNSIISNVKGANTITSSDLRLLRIYILFEQDEEELYGLNFGADFAPEHGCGVKIKGSDFEIVEIGHAEIAFYI